MRILPFSLCPEGFEPPSLDLNQDQGNLEITEPSAYEIQEESSLVAETLSLQCTARPLPLSDRTPKVCLISESSPLEEATLYHPATVSRGYEKSISLSQWQGIAIEYAGMGKGVRQGVEFTFSGTEISNGTLDIPYPLYVKPFQTEKTSVRLRKTTVGPYQVLSSPPGKLNSVILRGYGGYYQRGIPLKECEQVYYGLTSDYEKTRIYLYSSALLRDQGTPSPQGGHKGEEDYIFDPPPREEESLSLLGAFAAGYARLTVKTRFGNLFYKSFLAEEIPGHSSLINVHFTPD